MLDLNRAYIHNRFAKCQKVEKYSFNLSRLVFWKECKYYYFAESVYERDGKKKRSENDERETESLK